MFVSMGIESTEAKNLASRHDVRKFELRKGNTALKVVRGFDSLSISFLHDTHPVLIVLQGMRIEQFPRHTGQLVVYRNLGPVPVPPEPELVDPPVVLERYRTLNGRLVLPCRCISCTMCFLGEVLQFCHQRWVGKTSVC